MNKFWAKQIVAFNKMSLVLLLLIVFMNFIDARLRAEKHQHTQQFLQLSILEILQGVTTTDCLSLCSDTLTMKLFQSSSHSTLVASVFSRIHHPRHYTNLYFEHRNLSAIGSTKNLDRYWNNNKLTFIHIGEIQQNLQHFTNIIKC